MIYFLAKISFFTLFWGHQATSSGGAAGHQILSDVYFWSRNAPVHGGNVCSEVETKEGLGSILSVNAHSWSSLVILPNCVQL